MDEDDEIVYADEIDSEKTLLLFLAQEKRRRPALHWKKVEFPTGRIAYTIFARASHHEPDELFIDDTDGSYSYWRSPAEFISEAADYVDRYIDIDLEQEFNEQFWDSPSVLFHGTAPSRKLKVLREGLEPRSETRGLRNRHVGASIFASFDSDFAGSYGEVLSIDTRAMKRAGVMPRVSREPEVDEAELIGALAHKLGVSYDIEYGDEGISPDTVIIHGFVPPEFLHDESQ